MKCYNAPVTENQATKDAWDAFLSQHPDAHLLQTSAWGALKASFGWDVAWLQVQDAGAQVLFRKLPLGLRLAYVPKGPVGAWSPDLLQALDSVCRSKGAFAVRIEPDAEEAQERQMPFQEAGFRPAPCIQPRRTLVVDLNGSEDDLLARMHQKTRYNVRLAARKGITVRPWDDLDGFARMMQHTAERDSFGAHTPAYYRRAYESFHPQGECELLVAEFEGAPLASLMVFARGERAWYFYGASTSEERNRMPTYRLQWEAMLWAKRQGCSTYDLWGIPDFSPEALEGQFRQRSDGLWGVYRFKRGFGGRNMRSAGAWDRVYQRRIYALYKLGMRVFRR